MQAKRFQDKVAIVTSGSKDIGRSTTLKLVPEGAHVVADTISMLRIGTPEEIAQAICFLVSYDASFITGVILPVGGGKTPQMHIPDFDLTALDNRKVT